MGRDINRLVPPRIKVRVYDSSLGQPLLVLISKNDIGVAQSIDIAGLEIFGLDYLNGKNVVVDFSLPLLCRRAVPLNDFDASINVDFSFELIQLPYSEFNIVELYKGLFKVSVSSNKLAVGS